MSWSEDYREATIKRDAVIARVVPKKEQEEVTLVMRGVELGLLATDQKEAMKVSRKGTEVLDLYIRYLERKLYDLLNLDVGEMRELLTEIECPKCHGMKHTKGLEGRKAVYNVCPQCFGKGVIFKEQGK